MFITDTEIETACARRLTPLPAKVLAEFLREDAGTPLGRGMPSGSPLRIDGERHYDAWLRISRHDPCVYCASRTPGELRTIEHIEPRSKTVRGLGGAHSWLNTVAACEDCNGKKGSRKLLLFLLGRVSLRHSLRP